VNILAAEGEGTRYEPFYLVAVPPGWKGGGDAEPGLSSGSDGWRRPDGRAGSESALMSNRQLSPKSTPYSIMSPGFTE
jgi:hypothetical protein